MLKVTRNCDAGQVDVAVAARVDRDHAVALARHAVGRAAEVARARDGAAAALGHGGRQVPRRRRGARRRGEGDERDRDRGQESSHGCRASPGGAADVNLAAANLRAFGCVLLSVAIGIISSARQEQKIRRPGDQEVFLYFGRSGRSAADRGRPRIRFGGRRFAARTAGVGSIHEPM